MKAWAARLLITHQNEDISYRSSRDLNKIFDKYREDAAGEPDTIGIDGTMKYFSDADVDLEGLDSFAVLEIVQAPTMGEINREGFVNGWQERK